MSNSNDTDDFEALIDRAVDTFFVEGPADGQVAAEEVGGDEQTDFDFSGEESSPPAPAGKDDLTQAVDSLFMDSFSSDSDLEQQTMITSGDDETDRAIDLAVDTLFVEEPHASDIPETTVVPAEVVKIPEVEDLPDPQATVPKPQAAPPPPQPAPPEPTAAPPAQDDFDLGFAETSPPETAPLPSHEEQMTEHLEQHLGSMLDDVFAEETVPQQAPDPIQAQAPAAQPVQRASSGGPSPLKQLQEAILTLEWEISRRSVKALVDEIRLVRKHYQENVTVDFAALSMRVVLDYVVKRMSRAHPESIRFLLEVADFLDRSVSLSESDPLRAFHFILTRYEKYKSLVRKAEGLPDPRPTILDELDIMDPQAFSKIVESQAKTLVRAGNVLAKSLAQSDDPKNLIRSFRFLVNRSANRILEQTNRNSKAKPPSKGQVRRKRRSR